jgi:hypothetical protein
MEFRRMVIKMKTIKKVFISEGSDIGRTNLFCVEYDSDNE